jgi:hypothetical protein
VSLNRIAKRRAYLAQHPGRDISYHQYAIATGDRHPTFQKNARSARAEHGLRPTSSDMCRVHGRRVA